MADAHPRPKAPRGAVQAGIPRAAEVALALTALIIAAPVLAAASAVIALTSRGPLLFRQKRVGRGGEPFVLFKLRTMRISRGGPEVTARDDVRLTPFGKLLRQAKLDELPQLWNVVRGEMSLVGPRPEVPRYVDFQDPSWIRILRVRPGITDPVTVRLRDEETLLAGVAGDRELYYRKVLQPLKLRAYEEYLERRSWQTDLRVLCQTLLSVAGGKVSGGAPG